MDKTVADNSLDAPNRRCFRLLRLPYLLRPSMALGAAVASAVALIGVTIPARAQATSSAQPRVLWRVNPSPYPVAALAISTTGVFATVSGSPAQRPERGTIFRLDRESGRTVIRQGTAGQPFLMTTQVGDVWVGGTGLANTDVVGANQVMRLSGTTLQGRFRADATNPIGIATNAGRVFVLSSAASGSRIFIDNLTSGRFRHLATMHVLAPAEGNPLVYCGGVLNAIGVLSTNSDVLYGVNSITGRVLTARRIPQAGNASLTCDGQDVAVAVTGGDVYVLQGRSATKLLERALAPTTGLVYAAGRWWCLSTGKTTGAYVLRGVSATANRDNSSLELTLHSLSGGPGILRGQGNMLMVAIGEQVIAILV